MATPSGDNAFAVQHLSANRASSSTIGLQDPGRSICIQYLFDGDYHRGAAPLAPKCYTPCESGFTDEDGKEYIDWCLSWGPMILGHDDPDVAKVRDNIYDPFEYLVLRHKHGQLKTDFKNALGSIAYHVACHLRVQNIGMKTRELLQLVPDTRVEAIERCSGHDGTYGVRAETYEKSQKIARPVVSRVKRMEPDYLVSDCPMAATQIANNLDLPNEESNPLTILRKAYGI